jgi:hypothetical protein
VLELSLGGLYGELQDARNRASGERKWVGGGLGGVFDVGVASATGVREVRHTLDGDGEDLQVQDWEDKRKETSDWEGRRQVRWLCPFRGAGSGCHAEERPGVFSLSRSRGGGSCFPGVVFWTGRWDRWG